MPVRSALIIIATLVGVQAIAQDLTSAKRYVYTVEAKFPGQTGAALLTGFRLANTKGIVTCLHGVVGASSIKAYNNDTGDVIPDLQIILVDTLQDVALLRSAELAKRPAEGLQPSQAILAAGEQLTGLGHPKGINLHVLPGTVNNPPIVSLSSLISPGKMADAFAVRDSPRSTIDVINLFAPMIPGDSGAPMLNRSGQVSGIVDGGLGEGDISWAIPIKNLNRWQDAGSARGELARIGRTSVNLFALDTDHTFHNGQVIVSMEPNGDFHSIQEAIAEAPEGSTVIVREGTYPISFQDPDRVDPHFINRLKIEKSLNIVGEGNRDNIIISGVISIRSTAKVKIDGITVNGGVGNAGSLAINNARLSGDGLSVLSISDNSITTVSNSEIHGMQPSGEDKPDRGATPIRASGGTLMVENTVLSSDSKQAAIWLGDSGKAVIKRCQLSTKGYAVSTGGAEVRIDGSDLRNVEGRLVGVDRDSFNSLFFQPFQRELVRGSGNHW